MWKQVGRFSSFAAACEFDGWNVCIRATITLVFLFSAQNASFLAVCPPQSLGENIVIFNQQWWFTVLHVQVNIVHNAAVKTDYALKRKGSLALMVQWRTLTSMKPKRFFILEKGFLKHSLHYKMVVLGSFTLKNKVSLLPLMNPSRTSNIHRTFSFHKRLFIEETVL